MQTMNAPTDADFAAMMREVDSLLSRDFPLGLAFVVGEMDAPICRQIRRMVERQADYVSWVVTGPVMIAVFHKSLFEELRLAWRQVLAGSGDVVAGVAFSDALRGHAELLLAARIALHRAMAERTDLVVLDGAEAQRAVADHGIAAAMRKQLAAGGGDFTAHFQPQVRIGTGQPVGAEALARWSLDGEPIPPSRFIPIAEEAGLIGEIGQMMLASSARTINVLRRGGIEIPRISVNVSPAQSRQADFLRTALDILHAERLSPKDIELEITESLVGAGGDDFHRWLAELAAAGFEIAIDDFGTGTSSLARLREIPAGKIKLDRAFVTALPHDADARTVCRTALDMVRGLGKMPLAEGVEQASQAVFLDSLGCVMGQGFLWARPMAERDLMAWWRGGVAELARPAQGGDVQGRAADEYRLSGSDKYGNPRIPQSVCAAYIA